MFSYRAPQPPVAPVSSHQLVIPDAVTLPVWRWYHPFLQPCLLRWLLPVTSKEHFIMSTPSLHHQFDFFFILIITMQKGIKPVSQLGLKKRCSNFSSKWIALRVIPLKCILHKAWNSPKELNHSKISYLKGRYNWSNWSDLSVLFIAPPSPH